MERAAESESTREQILRVAEQLFLEHGYAAVSMNRVIAALAPKRRLTKPALYYHFRDKEALYVAVCLAMSARWHERLCMAIARGRDLEARVMAVCEVLAEVRAVHLQRMLADMREHLSAEARAAGQLRPEIPPRVAAEALLVLAGNLSASDAGQQDVVSPRLITTLLLRGIARGTA